MEIVVRHNTQHAANAQHEMNNFYVRAVMPHRAAGIVPVRPAREMWNALRVPKGKEHTMQRCKQGIPCAIAKHLSSTTYCRLGSDIVFGSVLVKSLLVRVKYLQSSERNALVVQSVTITANCKPAANSKLNLNVLKCLQLEQLEWNGTRELVVIQVKVPAQPRNKHW